MEKVTAAGAERREVAQDDNPYREVFLAIEAMAETQNLSPQAAYELYEEYLLRKELDPTIYLSMAITSGGYARDGELDIGQVITNNTDFGTLAKEALLRQHPELSEADIILPSDLGKVRGWSQSDYLLFWFHVIVGLNADDAAKVSEHMAESLSYPGFTDKSLTPEQKWDDYARFTRDYVKGLRELAQGRGRDLQPNNMQAMIMILDGDMSLGGRAEAELCRAIGIPPQQQMLDALVVTDSPELQAATSELRALGAHALGLSLNPPGMQFVGWSAGPTNPNLAFELGFRKTGLANAVFAADYYAKRPGSRPPRHGGHYPLTVPA